MTERPESYGDWLTRHSAYDKKHGIRRVLFAEYDARRAGEYRDHQFDIALDHTVHASVHLIHQRGKPPEWHVQEWCVPLLEFRDAYRGESLDETKTAWLKVTRKALFDLGGTAPPGFWRRDDVPRWLYGENVDVTLRATDAGQNWASWTTAQWVAHLWPTKWTMRLPKKEMEYYRHLRWEELCVAKMRVAKRRNPLIQHYCDTMDQLLKPAIATLRKKGQRLPP